MHVKIDVSTPKAFKQKCARSLGKFIGTEHLRGPERIRECGNVPGRTPTLANVFRRNVSASGFVPPGTFSRRNKSAMTPVREYFKGRNNNLSKYGRCLTHRCDASFVPDIFAPGNALAVRQRWGGPNISRRSAYFSSIAGKFGEELNLAVWRSSLRPPN